MASRAISTLIGKTRKPLCHDRCPICSGQFSESEFSRRGASWFRLPPKDKLRRQLQKNMDLSNGSATFFLLSTPMLHIGGKRSDTLDFVGSRSGHYPRSSPVCGLNAVSSLLKGAAPRFSIFTYRFPSPSCPCTRPSRGQSLLRGNGQLLGKLKNWALIVAPPRTTAMNDKRTTTGRPCVDAPGILDDDFGAGHQQSSGPMN